MVDWSGMPIELLEEIAGNLDEIADRIKFGAVCKRWCYALKSAILPRVRLPWILVPSDDEKVLEFRSFSGGKIYSINHNLNNIGDRLMHCICCSDSGWLLMTDFGRLRVRAHTPVCPLLFNPITGCQISHPQVPDSSQGIYKCNIIVSPNDESIAVMMIPDSGHLLWCYRVFLKSLEENPPAASSSWTSLLISDLLVDDIPVTTQFTYYRGHYFISVGESLSTAIVDPDTNKVLSIVPPLAVAETMSRFHKLRYLVRSSTGDELFLVVDPSSDFNMYYEVFKWDSTEQRNGWSKVRSIGRDTVFIGHRNAIALQTGTSGTFIRENCIIEFGFNEENRVNMNLFDIGDGSVELHQCFLDSETDVERLHWFLPLL